MAGAPLYLSAEDLLARTDPPAMVAAMERAFRAMASGALVLPPREHLEHGQSTLLVMPSAGDGIFATKLVTLTPANAERGLPTTQGIVLLSSAETGEPLAMMDAGVLTGQRTGAVAAIGIKHLAPQDIDRLGIIGCGVQGAWAAIHAAAVRPLSALFCVARSQPSFDRFTATIGRFAPQLRIIRSASVEAMLGEVECALAATTSTTPVLPDDPDLLEGKLLISIGSYRPHMRELPDAAFRLAGAIVVDSPQAITEVGDVIDPVEAELLAAEAVIQLAAIVAGTAAAPGGATKILKCVGHAAFDLFAAKAALEQEPLTR